MAVSTAVGEIESSIIIPMHNEIHNAQRCIENVENCLRSLSIPYEIVIAEDGSTDGTREFVEQAARNNPNIRCTCSEARLGKGLALVNAFKLARGKLTVIVDADLTNNPECLRDLIRKGKDVNGLVVGSRVLGGVANRRPVSRRVASWMYNLAARLFFGDNIGDRQCGFKALSRNLVDAVLPYLHEKGFAWDTEIIALARKLGYSVSEMPTRIVEQRDGLESKVRIVKDGLHMGWSLLVIKYRSIKLPAPRVMGPRTIYPTFDAAVLIPSFSRRARSLRAEVPTWPGAGFFCACGARLLR
jgi:glycosyltransferase involved in cell wall biosynthesis